jgi:glycopeptide antibiotics resistance protein
VTYYFLNLFARRLPTILVALSGIVFAIVRFKRHLRVSILTLLGLIVYLLMLLVFIPLGYWLPELGHVFHLSESQVGWAYTMIYVLEDLVYTGILILLVAAAFSQRNPMTSH